MNYQGRTENQYYSAIEVAGLLIVFILTAISIFSIYFVFKVAWEIFFS